MLVLIQSIGDNVYITTPDGEVTIVTIVAMGRNRVRVGYKAPRHITIDREKVHKRKQLELPGAA